MVHTPTDLPAEPSKGADMSDRRTSFNVSQRTDDIVNRYRQRLARYVHGRLRNPTDAEDLLQDVWAVVIQKISDWQGTEEDVVRLTFGVARNQLLNLYRTQRSRTLQRWLEPDGVIDTKRPEQARREEVCRMVDNVVREMAHNGWGHYEELQAHLLQPYADGRGAAARIAQSYGMTATTFYRRVRRLRKEFRKRFRRRYGEDFELVTGTNSPAPRCW